MMPEAEIKKKIKDYLKEIGAFWSAIKGGAHSKPGDPDLVVCYKGKFIGIEAKTQTGVQSPMQKLREQQIKDAGGIYILARSVDDVKEGLKDL